MPIEKKTTTRRDMLKVGLGALPAITIGGSGPFLVPKVAVADGETPGTPGPKDNILGVVQLSGGNDGLNTVIPYGDDVYHRNRFALDYDQNAVLKIDDIAEQTGKSRAAIIHILPAVRGQLRTALGQASRYFSDA